LLPAPAGAQAADAYRSLRHIQHQARLNEEPTQRAADIVAQERAAGLAVWKYLFESPSAER
jgi:glutamate-ammonia-ligase adenylyltransferase